MDERFRDDMQRRCEARGGKVRRVERYDAAMASRKNDSESLGGLDDASVQDAVAMLATLHRAEGRV
jgi:hypothetical protein